MTLKSNVEYTTDKAIITSIENSHKTQELEILKRSVGFNSYLKANPKCEVIVCDKDRGIINQVGVVVNSVSNVITNEHFLTVAYIKQTEGTPIFTVDTFPAKMVTSAPTNIFPVTVAKKYVEIFKTNGVNHRVAVNEANDLLEKWFVRPMYNNIKSLHEDRFEFTTIAKLKFGINDSEAQNPVQCTFDISSGTLTMMNIFDVFRLWRKEAILDVGETITDDVVNILNTLIGDETI